MAISGSHVGTGVAVLGLVQAGLGVAFAKKLSRNMRIASAVGGALSGISLLHQAYQWREQSAPVPRGLRDAVNYESLPELPLANVVTTEYCPTVKAEDMTAPVMKGVDARGRHFIALRIQPKDFDTWSNLMAEKLRAVYQELKDAGRLQFAVTVSQREAPGEQRDHFWVEGGNHQPFRASFFSHGQTEAHAEMKAFIDNGGNDTYELV